MNLWLPTRRKVLQTGVALGAASLYASGAFAEQLAVTATLTEGPFYPDRLPLDTDNDLLVINDALTPAVGEITYLTGRVLSAQGAPVRNAFVEIWQVDGKGVYLHSGDNQRRNQQDKNFQGYGRFLTDAKGQYYFRTIKPVPYPGRTPHIHVAVSRNGRRIYTTQLFVNGHAGNKEDFLLKQLRTPQEYASLMVDFKPLEGSKIGELAANFDVVLGVTPQELQAGERPGGGVGKPEWNRRRQP